METWICVTCGTLYQQSTEPPKTCPICEDDRQYVGEWGQKWTTLVEMHKQGYHNAFIGYESGLIGIHTVPQFGIGQRALYLRTPQGNYLWDCITHLDDVTVQIINSLGGIDAIAISHPHYYSAMTEWAERFDAPILLHENDKEWVMKSSDKIQFWRGETCALPGSVTLVNIGGHFPGSTIMHWKDGADGKGAIFTGDSIQVVEDKRYVSFMYSYPNLIPLSATEVTKITGALELYDFDKLYGFTADRLIDHEAKQAVMKSAHRYLQALDNGIRRQSLPPRL